MTGKRDKEEKRFYIATGAPMTSRTGPRKKERKRERERERERVGRVKRPVGVKVNRVAQKGMQSVALTRVPSVSFSEEKEKEFFTTSTLV